MEGQDVKLPDNDAVNNLPYDDDEEGFNLHDLLPDELKEALDEATPEPPAQQAVADEPPVPPQVSEPITEEAEEVKFDPESIDKLIAGDINALNQPEPDKEESPYWVEDEEYKDLTQALEHTKYTPDTLNSFIRKVADKSVVDNSQLTNNLRKEVDDYKRKLEANSEALAEAKELKKAWFFDKDPEVQAKYHKPTHDNVQKIEHVLRQEGAKLTAAQIVNITNKATLLRTLQENGVDDAKSTEILSEWRARQDTIAEYNSARSAALSNAEGMLSASVSPQRVQNIVKNSLLDLIEQEDYADIKTALREGVDKHADISDVINKGRNNFAYLAKNLRPEQLHDETLMSNLAKYAISAANAERKQFMIPDIEKERDTWKDKAVKLASAYKKLASSAGGIHGRPTTPALSRARAKEENKSAEQLAEDWEKLLSSGDDLPMGKRFFPDDDEE